MKIVAFAPACNPLRGGETGTGWLWSRMVASLGEAWIITRPRNRRAIEEVLPTVPERDRLHFIYLDVRWWPKSWQKQKVRSIIDYLLWQPVAMREARRLHRDIQFDLAWHLTFANVWLGSLAGWTGPPFVYGPVGGGVGAPWRLLPSLGTRGAAFEIFRAMGRMAGRYLNPFARVAWSQARIILVQNRETRGWLPRGHQAKAWLCPNPVLDESFPGPTAGGEAARSGSPGHGGPTALYAGRLVPLKGIPLALRAMAKLPEWRLIVCGKGRDEERLRRLARGFGVDDRVEFRGFVPRSELMRFMREEADVMLFPSLHDEAGWVVAEAEASGLPVVCVDRGGPPVLGGRAVKVTSARGTASALARELERARAAGRTDPERGNRWTLPARTDQLRDILTRAGLLRPLTTSAP
jgi:glycosyltransferase involved in cell wall biosynthesis